MSNRPLPKSLALALGATLAGSLAAGPAAASENPFQVEELTSGYLASNDSMEGRCGQGKCGASMMKKKSEHAEEKAESRMKEGKCGAGMKMKSESKMKEGKCGAGMKMKSESKMKEGKCGAGMKMKSESKMKEGKCGTGMTK
ncbi:hypothetical protein QVG61_02850 [Thiohalobacter sp. IOR34]|uniref:HvfA family oxazolone/thioamide-modified RiPP metallophore n=1 Tax=Thiohalobacter sp. IOR34 TaxID=3057176 RepID=UPI0025B270DF|nr:hypothetical protein [Thiohalobacter sp. IOR34]WJW76048.1 hypothetical protein QVG61_02850 [Thiohalobacter sp. IOR34]